MSSSIVSTKTEIEHCSIHHEIQQEQKPIEPTDVGKSPNHSLEIVNRDREIELLKQKNSELIKEFDEYEDRVKKVINGVKDTMRKKNEEIAKKDEEIAQKEKEIEKFKQALEAYNDICARVVYKHLGSLLL
jgi:hypothetical protein